MKLSALKFGSHSMSFDAKYLDHHTSLLYAFLLLISSQLQIFKRGLMRRFLVWTPILFLLFLVQSYFWVPTYEQQTRGNPDRLHEYISASIGDAQILNPILSADSASSDINGRVFEGLLDRDKDLSFRGRLATHWEIYEEAYFYVNENIQLPDMESNSAEDVVRLLVLAKEKYQDPDDPVFASLNNIRDIQIMMQEKSNITYSIAEDSEGPVQFSLSVSAPFRIRLTLKNVDPDLFTNLAEILGDNYFSEFDPSRYITGFSGISTEKQNQIAEELLPAVEHNPIIQFYLRPGVKFHDGQPFDASDVKFTFDAIMDPKNLSPRVSDYEPVKSVEILDPMTVRIVYKRLFSPAVGTWSMGILPSHLLNEKALLKEALERNINPETFTMRQSSFNRNPVGCGPFAFQEWRSDQYIVLTRFEDYWEGPPNYQKFTYRIIPDQLTQEMEFYAGTVDEYGVKPHQVERLGKDPRFQNFSGLSFAYSFIGYNMRREIFQDQRVRTALGMALDVDKIIRYVLYDQGERITGPFLKQTDFYNNDIKPLPYDPQKALALLEEVGYQKGSTGFLEKDGKPLRFTLITNQGNDIRLAILAIAQDSWRKIGVDVRTDVLEWAVFIQERINKLDFDAMVLGWSMGIEPDLYQIWHSSQTGPNQLNFVNFNNAEADRLIIDIRQEYNHDRQVELCQRLHEIIAHEQPYTFLFVSKWTAILDKRIVIKEEDDDGNIVYRPIEPTQTGNYTFDFNKWIKLSEQPKFSTE
jgi:ABC-type transport system substrate-binding protein